MKILATGVYGFYSKDHNKDGFTEGEDYPFLQNTSEAFLEGKQATDLNGDGFVEGLYFPFFNNSDALLESIHL